MPINVTQVGKEGAVLGELACLLHLVVSDEVESCECMFTHGRALDVVLQVCSAVSAQCG